MRNLLRLSFLAMVGVALASCSGEEQKQSFFVCESTYALCTTAACTPVEGKKDTAACDCEVKTGYSLGQKQCQEPKDTKKGKQIRSRYYPVESYAVCDNDRPWAWCLDKPCVIDKDDPSKASCACTTVKDQKPWIMVTDTYSDTTCTTGLYSSATVDQVTQATDFLKTNENLKPAEIKVLNAQ